MNRETVCQLSCWFVAVVLSLPVEVALADPPAKPEIVAGTVEPLGTTGMTVNGTIHPHGSPTTWHVEYGPTAAYGKSTRQASLPPRLLAHYRETWDDGFGGWNGGLSGDSLKHFAEGGSSRGYVRYSSPSGDDPNHVDGIGTLHLCKYVYPAVLPGPGGLTLMLAAGDPDFRDAKVSISVRGNEWKPNGSELVWWTQSQSNIDKLYDASWRRANWAYTGFSLNDRLTSGRWERAEYRLRNDGTQWTYGGNNLAQKRPNYAYWPIDDAQRHLNNDFFHLLAYVDPKNRPQGSIDFDELSITYRNYSLLISSNGGKLVAAPQGSPEDAARLTDGWRHGEGKMWRSADRPAAPQEFVWKFDRPVEIEAVQIHQHTQHPSKAVETSVSSDGASYAPLATLALPEKSPQGPHFAYALARPKKTSATHFKAVVKEGYKADAWGLGEIEVFGSGARMLPEDEPNSINVDATELEPGTTYHYRIVATNETGTTHGPDRTFAVPATTKPVVVTGPAARITATSARLEGRLNPMGQRTQFHFEYWTDPSSKQKTTPDYGGLQITGRASFAHLRDLKPATAYRYRIVAENESGRSTGEEASFRTAAP